MLERLDDAGALVLEHLGEPRPEPVDKATIAEMIQQLSVCRNTDSAACICPVPIGGSSVRLSPRPAA